MFIAITGTLPETKEGAIVFMIALLLITAFLGFILWVVLNPIVRYGYNAGWFDRPKQNKRLI